MPDVVTDCKVELYAASEQDENAHLSDDFSDLVTCLSERLRATFWGWGAQDDVINPSEALARSGLGLLLSLENYES